MSARAAAGPALFPSGQILGRFRVEGVLGIGGTGTVFRAYDEQAGEDVAVKAIPHDAVLRQRARREAKVAARLEHPHVVRLREMLEDDEYVYVISDLIDGGDLCAALRAGLLSDVERVRLVAAVCDALAHAHERGVVHRDVKPANVLLAADGSVRLADFGIAAISDADATVDDRLLGTLSYMAPETCRGDSPAAAADVWAAGVLLYEVLTGANPFRARSPAELADRHGARVRPLAEVRPGLPRVLTRACARALAVSPSRRPSASQLARDLLDAAELLERGVEPERAPALRLVSGDALAGVPLPSLPDAAAVGRAGSRAARFLAAAHVPAPALRRLERVAGRVGPALCAGVAAGACLSTLPFWPASFVAPIAVISAVLALVAPWPAAAVVLAAVIPAVGNVSSGLAWVLGGLGAAWLLAAAGSGRRALLPALAPVLSAVLLFPLYLVLAGRCRTWAGRALAGAAGPVAVALWRAGPGAAAPFAGSEDITAVAGAVWSAAGIGLAVQSAVWALAAVAWPYLARARGPRLPWLAAGWLGLVCAGQGLLAPLAGASVGPVVATIAAVWIAAIVLALGVDLRTRVAAT